MLSVMRVAFFLFLLSLTLCSQAAIYKWVDSRGVVHYSDTPTRDAEEIQPSETTIYTPTGAASANSRNQNSAERPPERVNYSSFVIIAPGSNEVVRAVDGRIAIVFQSQPGLKAGHYIMPVLDGRILDQRLTGTVLELEDMARGGHMVHASIHDAAGRLLARSNIVQFFVRQETVIEDGKAPDLPDSGGTGQPGVDAPQFKPGAGSDFKPGSNDSTPGKNNPNYNPNQ